jgi:hypothetical protein
MVDPKLSQREPWTRWRQACEPMRLWFVGAVTAVVVILGLVTVLVQQSSPPSVVPARVPTLELGVRIDGGPLVRGAEFPISVGLGAMIEPVANVDWAGSRPGRVVLYLGDLEIAEGEAVAAERPGAVVLRAKVDGVDPPRWTSINLHVSRGPNHLLDIEVIEEGAQADGSECFTVRVTAKRFDIRGAELRDLALLVASPGDVGMLAGTKVMQTSEFCNDALVVRFCRSADDPPLPAAPREFSLRAGGTVAPDRTSGSFSSPFVAPNEADQGSSRGSTTIEDR